MRSLILAAMIAFPAAPQSTIDARPGVISYAEGRVFLSASPAHADATHPLSMPVNAVLRSGSGRAEVMLNPCAVLHLDEHSAVRMLTASFEDARVELLRGSAVVQMDGGSRHAHVSLVLGGSVVRLGKNGIYRLDGDPPRVQVYEGSAAFGGDRVSAGRALALSGGKIEKFDREHPDALYHWHEFRIRALVQASGLAAQEARERNERARNPLPGAAESPRAAAPVNAIHWPDEGFARGRPRICRP